MREAEAQVISGVSDLTSSSDDSSSDAECDPQYDFGCATVVTLVTIPYR